MFVARFPDQSGEHAEPFVLPVHRNTAYDADQEILRDTKAHLWPKRHVEFTSERGLVQLRTDEVPGTRDHVVEAGVDCVGGERRSIYHVRGELWTCVHKSVEIATPSLGGHQKGVLDMTGDQGVPKAVERGKFQFVNVSQSKG